MRMGEQQHEELLSSPGEKFAPVVVTCHWDYPEDIVRFREGLGIMFSHCDLLEPFERINRALSTVHEQGIAGD